MTSTNNKIYPPNNIAGIYENPTAMNITNHVQQVYRFEVGSNVNRSSLIDLIGKAIEDKANGFHAYFSPQEIKEVSSYFSSHLYPFSTFQSGDFYPIVNPYLIARKFAESLMCDGSVSFFVQTDFSLKLLNTIRRIVDVDVLMLNYRRDYFSNCSVAIVAFPGCDIHAITELLDSENMMHFDLFVQEAQYDELYEAIKKKFDNKNQTQLADIELRAKEQLGVPVDIRAKTALVHGIAVEHVQAKLAKLLIEEEAKLEEDIAFCRVISFMPFRNAAEAVKLANALEIPLAASIWAADTSLALSVAAALSNYLTVWINTFGDSHPKIPDAFCTNKGAICKKSNLHVDSLPNLLDLLEIAPYRGDIKELLTVDQTITDVPADVNVLVRKASLHFKVNIDWSIGPKTAVPMCIAALAFGNTVEIVHNDSEDCKQFLQALRSVVSSTDVVIDINKTHLDDCVPSPDIGVLILDQVRKEHLKKFLQPYNKYIWLPKIAPI